MPSPTCFISYSWESDEHNRWVRNLGTALQKNGVKVYLDQWDSHLGMDLTSYMETSIRESDFVLLICTPSFAEKTNGGTGGVGYEKSVVTGEIFTATSSPTKFVPIIRKGTPPSISLPSYLKSKLYVDFRNDAGFETSLEQLLRHIYESPKYERPALGQRPVYASRAEKDNPENDLVSPQFTAFRKAYEFAYSYDGLNRSRPEAEAFATSWSRREPIPDLEAFKLAYAFAYSYDGLNRSRPEAEAFATSWSRREPIPDLEAFKLAFAFAYSYDGLNRSRPEAEAFATKWIERFSSSDLVEFRTAFDFACSYNGMNKSRIEAEQYAHEVLASRKAPGKL